MNFTISIDTAAMSRLENAITHKVQVELGPEQLGKIKADLIARAKKVAEEMRDFIASHARRDGHTGQLEKAIAVEEVESTPTSITVGILNIDKVTKEAPYWHVLNYGFRWDTRERFIPPANLGTFTGGEGPLKSKAGGTDQWFHTGDTSMHLLEPKTFTPINYIQVGVSALEREVTNLVAKFSRK